MSIKTVKSIGGHSVPLEVRSAMANSSSELHTLDEIKVRHDTWNGCDLPEPTSRKQKDRIHRDLLRKFPWLRPKV